MDAVLANPFLNYLVVVVVGGGAVWGGVELSGLIKAVDRRKAKWIAGPLYAVIMFLSGWLPVPAAATPVASTLGEAGVFWANLVLAAVSGLLCTGLAKVGHDIVLHKLTPGGPPKKG